MTKEYEALVIIKSAGTEQEIARQAAQLEEQVKKVGGTMASSQSLGRRRLAFKILRQSEGYYYVLKFSAPSLQVAELERAFRLNESIVRFMVLSADELAAPGVAVAAAPARGA